MPLDSAVLQLTVSHLGHSRFCVRPIGGKIRVASFTLFRARVQSPTSSSGLGWSLRTTTTSRSHCSIGRRTRAAGSGSQRPRDGHRRAAQVPSARGDGQRRTAQVPALAEMGSGGWSSTARYARETASSRQQESSVSRPRPSDEPELLHFSLSCPFLSLNIYHSVSLSLSISLSVFQPELLHFSLSVSSPLYLSLSPFLSLCLSARAAPFLSLSLSLSPFLSLFASPSCSISLSL